MSIPLLLQNQVPEGFEEEEGPLKVDIRPESSKLEDYDAVPIEQFGLAMLRGMGFKAKCTIFSEGCHGSLGKQLYQNQDFKLR